MTVRPIIIEQTYAADIEVVWKAITDKTHMQQWFFESMDDFEAKVGFEIEFDVDCEGETYTHHWRVTEVITNKLIRYDWSYPDYTGESVVSWEVFNLGNETALKLTHTGQETFPQDNPVFSRESGEAGWTYLLNDRLKAFLANSSPG